MLYYLFNWFNRTFSPPGGELIRYITFRSAIAALSALVISFFIGPKIIARLKVLQVSEQGKVEAPKSHLSKAGTPMMGGLIILIACLGPTLLFADIGNTFIILIFLSTLILGGI